MSQTQAEDMRRPAPMPIAIIGIGCRFPGGANTPEAFWQLLCSGVNAISAIPPDRFDCDTFYDPRPATPGRIMTRWGKFYMTTGSGRYAASGRVSYAFGFQEPSITIDTACSSSLVAVHLACQSIWSGECAAAVAGGANVILQPHITIAYSQSQMMATDGRCKFGDRVLAVIYGSAVNQDGNTNGLTAPSRRR